MQQNPLPCVDKNLPDAFSFIDELRQDIERVPTTSRYSIALIFATILMVLLPIIYMAIIACVLWSVVAYAYFGLSVFLAGPKNFSNVLVKLAPLVAGSITLLFMIKPLFARMAQSEKPISLSRADEPKLFAFVDRLCQAVHAPIPKRIDVNCDVNASASFRSGLTSAFLNSDLVLTIGLPLVSGLTLQQLAEVFAHVVY